MARGAECVVIVTEDESLKNRVKAILEYYKIEVIIENSSLKSILKILTDEIFFLLLDFDYPENSIIDLITILKLTRPRLPIVVILERISRDRFKKLIDAGIFHYLLKPAQTEEIGRIIEAIRRFHEKDANILNTKIV
ncbi:MAG: response regulator [candidate division KSB1 bacterium]|jgi:two-component system response regulator YesN|nr:response regulator [candidate division KSB1 bacterium]